MNSSVLPLVVLFEGVVYTYNSSACTDNVVQGPQVSQCRPICHTEKILDREEFSHIYI